MSIASWIRTSAITSGHTAKGSHLPARGRWCIAWFSLCDFYVALSKLILDFLGQKDL